MLPVMRSHNGTRNATAAKECNNTNMPASTSDSYTVPSRVGKGSHHNHTANYGRTKQSTIETHRPQKQHKQTFFHFAHFGFLAVPHQQEAVVQIDPLDAHRRGHSLALHCVGIVECGTSFALFIQAQLSGFKFEQQAQNSQQRQAANCADQKLRFDMNKTTPRGNNAQKTPSSDIHNDKTPTKDSTKIAQQQNLRHNAIKRQHRNNTIQDHPCSHSNKCINKIQAGNNPTTTLRVNSHPKPRNRW